MNSEIPETPVVQAQNNQLLSPEAASLVLHHKQTFWQIWFPLIIAVALALFVGALAIFASMGPSSHVNGLHWANISLVALILVNSLVGLLFLVILAVVIYVLARLLNILPVYTQLGQHYINLVSSRIRKLADQSTQPVLTAQSWWAGAQKAQEHIQKPKQPRL